VDTFNLSQPAVNVDGLFAVPISITQIDASIRFDLASSVASVDITMDFIVGPTTGCPTFDLRQTISQAWLDGSVFSTGDLAHHDFGAGANTELRVLASNLMAGSNHSLRLIYNLDQPNAPAAVPIGWNGSRLSFDFWFTDLHPGRYLEMWLPANLLWDHYPVLLDIELTGTGVSHTLITNGSRSDIASNHWSINFPSTWNASCQMLVIEPSANLSSRFGSVTLPSGNIINTEVFKHNSIPTNLTTIEAQLHGSLTDNETDIGIYPHGSRFTVYLWPSSRAMEYAAATTTTLSALRHETFHSWFARGVFPANGQDGWWDEAITTWVGAGRPATYLGLSESRSTLCDRNRYTRTTPSASYSRGAELFAGISEEVGSASLDQAIRGIFNDYQLRPLSTETLEVELIARLGDIRIADYFERYVYGITSSIGANLWIRDAVGDPGYNYYTGSRFWDSPDLWIRNRDDGGNTHQAPEYGQDNWFYARVRNQGTQTARHFVVTFNPTTFAGTQFVYPNDWLPPLAVATGFDLDPGASTIVKAKWPRANIPVSGTHSCLLASVYTTADQPINGRRVWEHNNLAQKNLTVVNSQPDGVYWIDFQFGSLRSSQWQNLLLEVWRPNAMPNAVVKIAPKNVLMNQRFLEKPKRMNLTSKNELQPLLVVRFLQPTRVSFQGVTVNVNASSRLHLSDQDQRNHHQYFIGGSRKSFGGTQTLSSSGAKAIRLAEGRVSQLALTLSARESQKMTMEVRVPSGTKPGTILRYDLLQREATSEQIIGGISLQINVGHQNNRYREVNDYA